MHRKKSHNIIVKSINASLRLEFKTILYYIYNYTIIITIIVLYYGVTVVTKIKFKKSSALADSLWISMGFSFFNIRR